MQALRDPIHRNVPLETWAVDVLDTREMQRLRRIRQLGTAFLVYPGANHTRFEHSLGAHKLAQDATRIFQLPPEEARPIHAAALLHDVGHGPLSHLFEEVDPARGFRHEEVGVDLVRWSVIGDRLRSAGIDPRRVADLMQGRGPHARLVSGDIDVDRMDYLVRDAHYTGVRVSVDPERILHTLVLQDGQVLVREEGVTAVEALLLARFLMYPAVYFHHTCRSAETMLVAGLRSLLAQGMDFDRLRRCDDAEVFAELRQGKELAGRIAQRLDERRLFKRAFEGTWAAVRTDPFLGGLVREAAERAALERELADEAGLEHGEVLIDAPRVPLLREVEARVLRKDGAIVPLVEASTLVRTLLTAQMDHWRFWIFAPKDRAEAVRRAFDRRREAKTVKHAPP